MAATSVPVEDIVTPETWPPVRLLGVSAAARYLGTTPWQIRRLVWAKEISYIRLGQRILIDTKDLDQFVESRKVPATCQ